MNSTIDRPQYPRTQYNISSNRSHLGVMDGGSGGAGVVVGGSGLSQQSLVQSQQNNVPSLAQTPEQHPYNGPGSIAVGLNYDGSSSNAFW